MHWRDSLLMAPRSHLLEQRYRHTPTERDLGTVLSQMEELRELIEQDAPKSEKDQVRSLYLTLPYLTIPYLTLPYLTLAVHDGYGRAQGAVAAHARRVPARLQHG